MLGDGIVSFGVWPSCDVVAQERNASAKIVCAQADALVDLHRRRRVVVLALRVAEVHVERLALDLRIPPSE